MLSTRAVLLNNSGRGNRANVCRVRAPFWRCMCAPTRPPYDSARVRSLIRLRRAPSTWIAGHETYCRGCVLRPRPSRRTPEPTTNCYGPRFGAVAGCSPTCLDTTPYMTGGIPAAGRTTEMTGGIGATGSGADPVGGIVGTFMESGRRLSRRAAALANRRCRSWNAHDERREIRDGCRERNRAGRVTMTLTFTDDCPGFASSTADISRGGLLVGNYTANDCNGQCSGGYSIGRAN